MGVNQDYREAVKYIRQAATGVFPLALAQYNLAVYYENGLRGLSKDLNMALQLYHRAAAQGFDGAQYNLGVCYYYGEGVDKDIFKALRYYEAASAQGYAQAQSALGQCYLRGIGVKKDRTKAELLFRAAAAQETTERLWNLAWFLKYFPLNGNDKVEAVQLLRSVLEQDSNHPLALYELGHCYHKGLGVSRNVIEAMRYYVKYDCHPLKSLRGYPSFRSDYKAIEVEYKMLVS
jgi:TPR repeat protein